MDETATAARRNAEYKTSDMIQNFRNKMLVDVGNLLSKKRGAKDKNMQKKD
jgi:hypothetical protein